MVNLSKTTLVNDCFLNKRKETIHFFLETEILEKLILKYTKGRRDYRITLFLTISQPRDHYYNDHGVRYKK